LEENKVKHDESKLQAAIIKKLRGMDIFCHSIPNDFVRDARAMGTAVTMGLFPGVADLVVWWPSGIGYLEVKIPGGKLSTTQAKFMERCRLNNIRYDVIYSLDELDNLNK
jgi:hypothetical protein